MPSSYQSPGGPGCPPECFIDRYAPTMWVEASRAHRAHEAHTAAPAVRRYAAQAVTVDGYGETEIVVQGVDGEPNDWPSGRVVAEIPVDAEHTGTDDLDAMLADAGFTRVTQWTLCTFGVVATVTKEG